MSGLVIIACIAVLFVVVIFAVSLLMKRVVFAPVNLAREHCRQIAAGKLDVPVPIKRDSGNEIDHLMSSMEQMREFLGAGRDRRRLRRRDHLLRPVHSY